MPPRGSFFGAGSDSDGDVGSPGAQHENRSGSAWRAPRQLQVQGQDVAPDACKRFTPETVSSERCLSRVWSNGRGAQCSRRPLAGEALCMLHHGEASNRGGLRHGLVTGEIPREKLLGFLNSARGREEK